MKYLGVDMPLEGNGILYLSENYYRLSIMMLSTLFQVKIVMDVG